MIGPLFFFWQSQTGRYAGNLPPMDFVGKLDLERAWRTGYSAGLLSGVATIDFQYILHCIIGHWVATPSGFLSGYSAALSKDLELTLKRITWIRSSFWIYNLYLDLESRLSVKVCVRSSSSILSLGSISKGYPWNCERTNSMTMGKHFSPLALQMECFLLYLAYALKELELDLRAPTGLDQVN